MGIYGPEEQFGVGEYQFDVGFGNDSDVDLSRRDIYVGQRRKVEDLTLAEFTGSPLLQAYRGPDADQRKNAFTHRREALVASYKEASRAPHAKSARLLRQEKKDLTGRDLALAQELYLLDPSLFDRTRVQGQVQQTEHSHFLRSCSFDEVNARYIHNFCRTYATDAAYQRLRAQEQASERACTQATIDPQMQEIVASWNALPGGVVNRSCQGASGVFRFEGKTRLSPSAHKACTTRLVVSESEAGFEAIGEAVAACPHLCLVQLTRPLRSTGSGVCLESEMHSSSVLENLAGRADLLRATSQLKARVRA